MLRWIRNHWKLLAGLLLAGGLTAAAVALFLLFPPSVGVVAAIPLIGVVITALPQAVGAAVLGVATFLTTLSAVAAFNVVYQITSFFDRLIKPKEKKQPERDGMSELEQDEIKTSAKKMERLRNGGETIFHGAQIAQGKKQVPPVIESDDEVDKEEDDKKEEGQGKTYGMKG